MSLSKVTLSNIINASDFDLLVGEIESEWFECKRQPYQIEKESQKRELAKDVSSFANAQGGYIFIGVRTKTSITHFGDEVEKIRPFDQSLLNTNQYHDIIKEWVYPEVENVSIQWKPTKNDSRKGVVVIHIPEQHESLKPFLIKKTLDGEKYSEIVFGYAKRKRDISDHLSVIDLQAALRTGLNYENTLRDRLDNLELLVQQLVDQSVMTADRIEELISERIERALENE